YPSFSPQQWKSFWRARILPLARTIWWRVLHHKISCHANLHRILPDRFSSECGICTTALDTQEHFLLDCPTKWHVWQSVIQDCVLLPVHRTMIFDAIFFLVIPRWGLHRSWLSPIQLLTGILVGIWRVHWLSVFSNVPFNPTNVISSTHTL
ncbi:hypothetical protein BDB00DRAFT_750501, partial [Zychaea mexicana]|uniref:uncharacterized protein n=1 Tax=Zychaea mexicana TaxID=64656 RepID=UPI0022FEE1E4